MTGSLASAIGTGAPDETDKKSPKLLPLDLQKIGQAVEKEPGKIEGYLLKRRKRPMKGWHKVQCMYSPFRRNMLKERKVGHIFAMIDLRILAMGICLWSYLKVHLFATKIIKLAAVRCISSMLII